MKDPFSPAAVLVVLCVQIFVLWKQAVQTVSCHSAKLQGSYLRAGDVSVVHLYIVSA